MFMLRNGTFSQISFFVQHQAIHSLYPAIYPSLLYIISFLDLFLAHRDIQVTKFR
jgi:hypothetical protein